MWPWHGWSARWGLWRVTASVLNCRGDLTSGGTAAWRPGEGSATPYRKKISASNEMGFDRFFGKAWAAGKMHGIWNFGRWVPLGRPVMDGWIILRRLFGKQVPSAHIFRASSRMSLCACAVTSCINWEATDAIWWNSYYVYVCSCALNMFKTIEGPPTVKYGL